MTAVDPELRREMLERELHGINVELQEKIHQNTMLVGEIEKIMADKREIQLLLDQAP